jgi:hypothetical protein
MLEQRPSIAFIESIKALRNAGKFQRMREMVWKLHSEMFPPPSDTPTDPPRMLSPAFCSRKIFYALAMREGSTRSDWLTYLTMPSEWWLPRNEQDVLRIMDKAAWHWPPAEKEEEKETADDEPAEEGKCRHKRKQQVTGRKPTPTMKENTNMASRVKILNMSATTVARVLALNNVPKDLIRECIEAHGGTIAEPTLGSMIWRCVLAPDQKYALSTPEVPNDLLVQILKPIAAKLAALKGGKAPASAPEKAPKAAKAPAKKAPAKKAATKKAPAKKKAKAA